MNWDNFFYFAVASLLCWMGAGIFVYTIKRKKYISDILMITGILVFAIFITGYWIYIERPPMRTMGETRLLYSLFIASIGYATYKRWKYKWL
ncbi:MAG: cytochrome C assembly protein, partial [Tannerella sp.]|nr:cytochrome C assembly protein [Tannerella sp.]